MKKNVKHSHKMKNAKKKKTFSKCKFFKKIEEVEAPG